MTAKAPLPTPKRGKGRRFLRVQDIERGNPYQIVDAPVYVPEAESRFGRDYVQLTLGVSAIQRGTLALNETTYGILFDAFGPDPAVWVGKWVIFRDETIQTQRGTRQALIGRPFQPPRGEAGYAPGQ